MNHGPVKAKIVELVPGIRTYENRCYGCGFGFEFCKCTPKSTEWFKDRPITLADVLRAIGDEHRYLEGYGVKAPLGIDMLGEFRALGMMDGAYLDAQWNLTTDYDNQDQSVKDFIGKLLGV